MNNNKGIFKSKTVIGINVFFKEDNQILSSNLLFDILAKLLITLSMSGNLSE